MLPLQVITGSYLMPREKRSNGAQRQEQDEEDEDDEDAFGYEFVKDYKFNILHYVSLSRACYPLVSPLLMTVECIHVQSCLSLKV